MQWRNSENVTPVRTVIFFRAEGWYPLELPEDSIWAEHAALNPGTLRIADARTDETLWEPASQKGGAAWR